MKVKSCFSINMDPYRAGIEIGEALSDIKPEVIFLFPTIHYEGSAELVEAIYDALETDETILIGNTGDGFYEMGKVDNVGVAALGINSGGDVRWCLEYRTGVSETPFETTRECMEQLNTSLNISPNTSANTAVSSSDSLIYFLAVDFRVDTSRVTAALNESARGPVIGGLAGDDDFVRRCFVYANRETLTDGIALLAMEGDFGYEICVANDFPTVGGCGEITGCREQIVETIDNIPAMDFIDREMGKPLDVVDQGTITFKLMERENDSVHRLRSILMPGDADGSQMKHVRLMGDVKQGNRAQVCLAPPNQCIRELKTMAGRLDALPFTPLAALIVSCTGRKKVLTGDVEREVLEIVEGCGSIKAVAGYPSFGEFGPLKRDDGYTDTLFHNMTYIMLLMGPKTQ